MTTIASSKRAFLKPAALVVVLVILAAALLVAGGGQPAYAAAITVTTTDDELNSDGDCSLREAIQAANTDLAVDACTGGSGADTIVVPAGTYTLTIGLSEAPLFGSHLRIDSDLTLSGAGAGNTIIEAGGNFRVFLIFSNVQQPVVTMSGLTIRNGKSFGANPGGGIQNGGTLTIDQSIINDNYADHGGGIYSKGTLTITNSTVRDNGKPFPGGFVQGSGGGIRMFDNGTLIISNSTVSGNGNPGVFVEAFPNFFFGTRHGGGIYSCNGCTLTMTNSTVSGNVSSESGGGIWAMHNATITNSTITNNTTQPGPNHGAGIAFKIKVQNTSLPTTPAATVLLEVISLP